MASSIYKARSGGALDSFGSVYIASPSNKTIPLFTATRPFTINQVRGLDLGAGTLTLSIQINGVNVTGLSSLSVTTTDQNLTATAANTGVAGDRVTAVIASATEATDLEFTMGVTLN
jgi:hypothetical protein